MYSSTAGAVAVNGSMDNITFSSYLRDRFNNQASLLCCTFPAERPQRLAIRTTQTTNNPQSVFGAAFRPPPKAQAFSTSFGWRPLFHPSLNMTGEVQGYFKDHVRAPEEVYLPGGFTATTPYSQHHGLPFSSSWPADNSSYTYPSAAQQFPLKIDNSPALSVPSVLPRDVDTSKYENLPYTEWYAGRTEYDSSSPSSSEYYSSSPATPNDVFSENWMDQMPPLNKFTYGESSAAQFRPHGLAGVPFSTITLPTSNPVQPPYATPTGLQGPSNLLHSALHGHPTYAQFHHHHMTEPSLSPPSLEVRTPSESDIDNADDVTSSNSPAQTLDYHIAEGDVDSRERRDELLVQMRKEDYSYKEIKRLCRFKEAESTLRGRHRALTKDREERVRKPQWKSHDVKLLCRSVKHYSNSSKAKMRGGRRKLPWKKISERMRDQGSSYLFAPATCAKKWESLEN